MIEKGLYGTLPDGREVTKYSIKNRSGESIELLDLGASLHSAYILDRDGNLGDILLGATSAEELAAPSQEGAVMGRVANRIANGRCVIEGREVQLETSQRDGNFLHSGSANYAYQLFTGEAEKDGQTVTFRLHDGGGAGFTVPVEVQISYTFTDDHRIRIHYVLTPEGTTLLCPTNHAYFNLGNYSDVREHFVQIEAEYMAKKSPYGVPEGDLLAVEGTPADFRKMTKLGTALRKDPEKRFFQKHAEFDDVFVIPGTGMRRFAQYYAPETGRCMETWSDMDSMILFTPGMCDQKKPKYGEAPFPKFGAICFETQYVPNAINCGSFRIPLFHSGERLDIVTEYRFSCKKRVSHELMSEIKETLMEEAKTWPLDRQFEARLVRENTWALNCFNPSIDTPKPHVLIGETCALVVDPTDSIYDIRSYIEKYITDKPLKVACTHSHGDHTLANWRFQDCEIFMSQLAWEDIQKSRETDWTANPRTREHQKGDYVPTILKSGDTLNLGNRELEVLPYHPCHSPSSLIFLDKTCRILFTGDEIDPGQINIWGVPVETLRDNFLGLKARAAEFDLICAPHNGTPMDAKILDYYIENCERILGGIEGDLDKGSMSYLLNPFEPRSPETVARRRFDPDIRRSFWKGTAINYNVRLLFNNHQR